MFGRKSGQDRSTVTANLWQRISVALWRGNAGIVLQHCPHTRLGRWDLPPLQVADGCGVCGHVNMCQCFGTLFNLYMCVYVYVCMYVNMFIHVYVYTYVCVSVYMCIYKKIILTFKLYTFLNHIIFFNLTPVQKIYNTL